MNKATKGINRAHKELTWTKALEHGGVGYYKGARAALKREHKREGRRARRRLDKALIAEALAA